MARTLSAADSLAKLLDESSRPVYVIDSQRRIVYCNAALSEWIDLPPKRIIGRRVEYHSEEPKTDDRPRDDAAPLTDLCPAPSALAGCTSVGTISCQARDGRILHRAAEFVPIDRESVKKAKKASQDSDDAPTFSVVVLLAREDMSSQEIASGVAGQSSADELHRTIRRFRRGQSQLYSIKSLLGVSTAMQKVRSQADAAAASGVNTLIWGNAGSGRAHIARAIYYKNSADDARLLPIDCRILVDELMERTLDRLRTSRGSSGPRPTLLLENLECMAATHQSQLLAAIRENRIAARILATIGTQPPPISDDAAINGEEESLETQRRNAEPHAQTTLPALVDTISTIAIRVPPLAERIEDLPILAQFFLEACNKASSKQIGAIRSEALDSLSLYSWPGELEQLRETIEAAHEACQSHEIATGDLPPIIHRAFRAAVHARKQPEPIVLDDLLAAIEKEAILRALSQSGGNKSEAATLLGMTRPRFYRRLVQLGLAGEAPDTGAAEELPEFIEHDAAE